MNLMWHRCDGGAGMVEAGRAARRRQKAPQDNNLNFSQQRNRIARYRAMHWQAGRRGRSLPLSVSFAVASTLLQRAPQAMATLQRCTRFLSATQPARYSFSNVHLRHSAHLPPSTTRLSPSSIISSPSSIFNFSPIRFFAPKATPEPLQTLDDVNFEWQSPVGKAAQDVRSQRRLAAQQRAQAKAERGARRLTARRQREEERRVAAGTTDLRGIDPDKQSPVNELMPFLPPQLSPTDLSSLNSLTSPLLSSSRQLRALRISSLVSKYAKTEADTGSAEVQVAVLTERLTAMARHRAERRGDVQAIRTENRMKQRRRKLLKWLRRHNFPSFELMMKDCRIVMDDVDGVGRTEKSGNQAKRPARSG